MATQMAIRSPASGGRRGYRLQLDVLFCHNKTPAFASHINVLIDYIWILGGISFFV